MPDRTNQTLVTEIESRASSLFGEGGLNHRVLAALLIADRAAFLPVDQKHLAYRDDPVPIGWGQTCSQPSLVAFLIDRLDVFPGARVLEVGAGCGYVAALISLLCGPSGKVVAVERLPELAAMARDNCVGFPPVEVVCADGSMGLPDRAPFDRIILSAGVTAPAFQEAPLLSQLAPWGLLLYPEAQGRVHFVGFVDGITVRKSWGDVTFVPLLGANGLSPPSDHRTIWPEKDR